MIDRRVKATKADLDYWLLDHLSFLLRRNTFLDNLDPCRANKNEEGKNATPEDTRNQLDTLQQDSLRDQSSMTTPSNLRNTPLQPQRRILQRRPHKRIYSKSERESHNNDYDQSATIPLYRQESRTYTMDTFLLVET